MLAHLDLFSGIGGFALACEWAGIETIGFVEIDKYCQKVLRKHWPDVPIVEDIRDVKKIKEIVANATEQSKREPNHKNNTKPINRQARQISCSRGTDAGAGITKPASPAILITAGFPCQPFSVAGKRGGEADNRYLWPETLAVIKAVKPQWVLLENVTGIINLALDTVLSDLEGAGYSYETLIIPACAVNAWHRRDRIWIIAFTPRNGNRCQQNQLGGSRVQQNSSRWQGMGDESGNGSQDVANTTGRRLQNGSRLHRGREGAYTTTEAHNDWAVEPELGRVADGFSCFVDRYFDTEPDIPRVATGVKNRVDRLKCLGNAIVPAIAFKIIRIMKEIDSQWEH